RARRGAHVAALALSDFSVVQWRDDHPAADRDHADVRGRTARAAMSAARAHREGRGAAAVRAADAGGATHRGRATRAAMGGRGGGGAGRAGHRRAADRARAPRAPRVARAAARHAGGNAHRNRGVARRARDRSRLAAARGVRPRRRMARRALAARRARARATRYLDARAAAASARAGRACQNREAVILTTERLILRPPELADAQSIQTLAGAREVALNTLLIPHPYPDGAAEAWISSPRGENDHVVALTLRDTGEIVGVMGLHANRDHARAEIGYWIGVPYWNRGYATEAARAMVRFGFGELGLNRIFAE